MTRIIAGSLGGRRIKVPQRGTRPTTDRVREAVFGRLDAQGALKGARVLDAFAGSGALGIEALSRGAARATFVDSSPASAKVIEANLRDLGLTPQGRVARAEVPVFLRRDGEAFDLALLDPPYDLSPSDLATTLASLAPRLTPGAQVVLEWSSRGEPPVWSPGIVPGDVRRYGDTSIHYAEAPGGTLEP
jgi:16S rRNA (guanine966-N2)-methyltransferase